MKHTDIKAFVRKYNSEFAIRGYSKMRKADLFGGSRSASPKMTGYNRDEMRGGWRGENEEGTGYATLKFTMTHPPPFRLYYNPSFWGMQIYCLGLLYLSVDPPVDPSLVCPVCQ